MDNQQVPGIPAAVGVLDPEAPGASEPPRIEPSGRLRRRLLIGGVVAVLVIVATAFGAVVTNALSQSYSAQRAVRDYFAAQAAGQVDRMLAIGSFDRPEGSYSIFLGRAMLIEMMQLKQNLAIRDVRIDGVRDIDSDTKAISVSMSWNGDAWSQTYTVRKDSSHMNWLFYPSWRIEIPSTTLLVNLPKQSGIVSIDGIEPPAGANPGSIQTIMGYHVVSMFPTAMLAGAEKTVDARSSTAGVSFDAQLNGTALASAKDAVTASFKNCDASKYTECFNHTYFAPSSNYIYFFNMPGYGQVDYQNYRYTLRGDPTEGMQLTVEGEGGKVTVSGSCAATMTVDGTRHYNFVGTYTGTLTWQGGGFWSDVRWECAAQKG